MLTTLGRCCKPVPASRSVATSPEAKGVTVHRASCVSIQHAQDPDRWWRSSGRGEHTRSSRSASRSRPGTGPGCFRDIAAVIAESKINLVGADVQVYDDRTAVISTSVEISNLTQLSRSWSG